MSRFDMKQIIKTAVVLAGGEGSRLRPLTNNIPKPMIKILGKPILQWIIEWLTKYEISNIIIGVAYKKESVMNYFKDGSKFNCSIKYNTHSVEGETGEGFRLAISRYVDDDIFLAMNGDEISNFNINDFVKYHVKYNPIATLAVKNPKSNFGVIKIDKNGQILSFKEKPVLSNILVSIGIYIFNRKILNYLPLKGKIENTTFPSLVKLKLIRAFNVKEDWLTINTIKDVENVENFLRNKEKIGKWLR